MKEKLENTKLKTIFCPFKKNSLKKMGVLGKIKQTGFFTILLHRTMAAVFVIHRNHLCDPGPSPSTVVMSDSSDEQ